MSAFKDQLRKDAKAVFINLREFADEHCLNGYTVACVIDKDLTQGAKDSFVGVFVNAVTIYVATEDMEVRPVEGEMLELDGVFHTVRSVNAEGDILAIVAEVNEQ